MTDIAVICVEDETSSVVTPARAAELRASEAAIENLARTGFSRVPEAYKDVDSVCVSCGDNYQYREIGGTIKPGQEYCPGCRMELTKGNIGRAVRDIIEENHDKANRAMAACEALVYRQKEKLGSTNS